MAEKCSWRYAPKTIMTRRAGRRPVVQGFIWPPNRHPSRSPVVKDMTAVELVADTGESRWFGVKDARINSQLRLVACGGFLNPQNELAREWKPCRTACTGMEAPLAGARRKRRKARGR